jgi:hypothetical protein
MTRRPSSLRYSPKIFGPNENEGLDIEASKALFDQMTTEINGTKSDKMTTEQVAAGFLRIANEAMCRPIRTSVDQRSARTMLIELQIDRGARLRVCSSPPGHVWRSWRTTRLQYSQHLRHQADSRPPTIVPLIGLWHGPCRRGQGSNGTSSSHG